MKSLFKKIFIILIPLSFNNIVMCYEDLLFLEHSPKLVSMGRVALCVPNEPIAVIVFNPGLYSTLISGEPWILGFNQTEWIGGIRNTGLFSGVELSKLDFLPAFVGFLISCTYTSIDKRDEWGNLTGEKEKLSISNFNLCLGLPIITKNKFSANIGFNLMWMSNPFYVEKNLKERTDKEERYGGVSCFVELDKFNFSCRLGNYFGGIGFGYIHRFYLHKISLFSDLVLFSNNWRTNIGAEVTIYRAVSFRSGLYDCFRTKQPGFGVGIRYKDIFLDLAYSTHEDLGNTFHVGLKWLFGYTEAITEDVVYTKDKALCYKFDSEYGYKDVGVVEKDTRLVLKFTSPSTIKIGGKEIKVYKTHSNEYVPKDDVGNPFEKPVYHYFVKVTTPANLYSYSWGYYKEKTLQVGEKLDLGEKIIEEDQRYKSENPYGWVETDKVSKPKKRLVKEKKEFFVKAERETSLFDKYGDKIGIVEKGEEIKLSDKKVYKLLIEKEEIEAYLCDDYRCVDVNSVTLPKKEFKKDVNW